MKKNLGTIDRVVRILVGLLIAVLYFTDRVSGTPAIILLIVAGVFVVTSVISYCPIYGISGISSLRAKK